MQSKGTLGSIIAGVIAIFLVLICLFYLSFTLVTNHYEKKADEVAAQQAGTSDEADQGYIDARKAYMDQISQEEVWLGYTYNEVRRWGVGLGLDLKGGMSVILQVSMPDLMHSIKYNVDDPEFESALQATIDEAATKQDLDFIPAFINRYKAARLEAGRPAAEWAQVFEGLSIPANASDEDVIKAIRDEVRDMVDNSATNVLRSRIDAFGVVSPNIQVLQGKDGQILLELPGVKEHQRVRDLLLRSANLEFYETYKDQFGAKVVSGLQDADRKAVAEGVAPRSLGEMAVTLNMDGNNVTAVAPGFIYSNPMVAYFNTADKAEVENILNYAIGKGLVDHSVKFLWGHKPEKFEGSNYVALYALKTNRGIAAMDGSHVRTASAEYDDKGKGAYVEMRMDGEGADQWSSLTAANIGSPVAIVLDNEVYSSPVVQNKIDGGVSSITGNFDVQEARDLANVLKSGKMTAKVDIISDMVIGPSLGQQAIHSGIISFIVALILLMILMIGYYGVIPGLVANFGLILNLFFTFGILSSFQAVLTLSGIAGIVLALGMAVDANVLIFERAKEELRAGKNARTAIAEGYSNAFSAIFDSNLTSIITGVILLLYGTGPIKGFATTLIIGIVCSFFTAVYLTRIIFILGAKKKPFERLTFTTALSRKLFKGSNYNFLGARKVSFTIALIVVAIVTGSLFVRGLNQGIDFSGGRNYVVKLDKAVDLEQLKAELGEAFDGAQVAVINIENANQVRISTNYKIDDGSQDVEDEIVTILYNVMNPMMQEQMDRTDFSTTNAEKGIISSQKVGPTVADDMRKDAYIAVTLSLIAMFLYILIRFRNVAFSLGALAAVAFTAYAIIGFYSLLYGVLPFAMEVDQTFIAAILTVIGYQINDTVVVFDRVRENTALFPKKSFFDVINMSINSTLGRTIMTSCSTLLVLVSIFCLGGDSLRSFILAMILGVIIGTCATIFIAAPVAYLTDRRRTAGKKVVAA